MSIKPLAAALAAAFAFAQPAFADDDLEAPICASRTADRVGPPPASTQGKPLDAVGLTSDQRLICFKERSPQSAREIGVVTGLSLDSALVGIDFRVQNGQLYGVGDAGGVYLISTDNAMATLVSRTTIALEGTLFGVDFNPAADRLRIVSNTGQNLRHNINAGGVTLLDGALSYAPPAVAMGVVGAAYTNNDLVAATATTLFDLDGALDQIALQVPPNSGGLAATGKLGVDAVGAVGFDIHSTLRGGVTVENAALAAITGASGPSMLYRVELTTGHAKAVGEFAAAHRVTAIAIPLNQR